MQKFELGEVIISVNLQKLYLGNFWFRRFLLNSLERYQRCSWGDINGEDWSDNDFAVLFGGERILAAYRYDAGKSAMYISTNPSRTKTTIFTSTVVQ